VRVARVKIALHVLMFADVIYKILHSRPPDAAPVKVVVLLQQQRGRVYGIVTTEVCGSTPTTRQHRDGAACCYAAMSPP